MKLLKQIILLFAAFQILACEKVVDIDLEESDPRLVIEASLIWDEAQNPLMIQLSTTAPYYDTITPPAVAAQVRIYDEAQEVYSFQEMDPGLYMHEGFEAVPGSTYELEVIYENQVYQATETLIPVPEIDFIEQRNDGGFSGDEIELRAFYTDPQGLGDYYLFRFFPGDGEFSLQINEDKLTDGNQNFASYSDEDLVAGQEVLVELQGISRGFYQYMYILRSQAGSGGGPFQTQPTIVRGNILNTTSPDNFAFGYFRLSQRTTQTHVVE